MSHFQPETTEELIDIVTAANADGRKLELRGGGTKANFGAPREADSIDLRALCGIIDYDPAELVIEVRAGTPLAEVRAAVAEKNQMLAFDPWEAGPLFGGAGQGSTIGGVIAAGIAGPSRISGGGARDHLLGFTAVSGRGESFVAGAKVVKNVTGYDLSKLMTGSWGRLAALTQITLKVMPRPAMAITLALRGLGHTGAIEAMSAALGSAAEVAAAAHLPCGTEGEAEADSLTLFQLRGFEPSVLARREHLSSVLSAWGVPQAVDEGKDIWSVVQGVRPLSDCASLWRIIVPPSHAAALIENLAPDVPHLFDWGGNLLWVGGDVEPAVLRQAARDSGGHAALVRAPEDMRMRIAALHPQPRAVAEIEARVRRAFDPLGVFETGRFQAPDNAD